VNIVTLVENFQTAASERAERSRTTILDLLSNHPAPFDHRSYDPGHITASAVLLSADHSRLLLVYHRRLGRWLRPGGHVEPADCDIRETARREVLEETGIELAKTDAVDLVGLDVHEIPATGSEPRHLHHDLTFCFTTRPDETQLRGSEQAVWCRIDQLDGYRIDEPLQASLLRALSLRRP
jgi:8-oxo-dGTP pyrophosphatase MutT (NUDIX family)